MKKNELLLSTIAADYNQLQRNEEYEPQRVAKFTLWDDLPQKSLVMHFNTRFPDKSNIKMLDIGCGTGLDMMFFKEMFEKDLKIIPEILGCDISQEMVNKCLERGLLAKCCDFRDESFPGTEFNRADVVWSNYGMIHIPIDELEESLNRLVELCATDGLIAIGFKTGKNEMKKDVKKEGDSSVSIERITSFIDPKFVIDYFTGRGMNLVYYNEFPHKTGSYYNYAWLIVSRG